MVAKYGHEGNRPEKCRIPGNQLQIGFNACFVSWTTSIMNVFNVIARRKQEMHVIFHYGIEVRQTLPVSGNGYTQFIFGVSLECRILR